VTTGSCTSPHTTKEISISANGLNQRHTGLYSAQAAANTTYLLTLNNTVLCGSRGEPDRFERRQICVSGSINITITTEQAPKCAPACTDRGTALVCYTLTRRCHRWEHVADLRRRIPDPRSIQNVVACCCASFHRVVLCTAKIRSIMQSLAQWMHEITALVNSDGRDDGPFAPTPAWPSFLSERIACLSTRRHSRARPVIDGARV